MTQSLGRECKTLYSRSCQQKRPHEARQETQVELGRIDKLGENQSPKARNYLEINSDINPECYLPPRAQRGK
jgi:hypothetical protein